MPSFAASGKVVDDQDVTGLLLKTVKGLSVRGTVVLDGTYDKSEFAKLAQLRVRAYVRNELPGSARIAADNEPQADAKLRASDEAGMRTRVRLAAETSKTAVELKHCQNVIDYQLPFKISAVKN